MASSSPISFQELRDLGDDGIAAVVPVEPWIFAEVVLDEARARDDLAR